jgi:hypothetical protein
MSKVTALEYKEVISAIQAGFEKAEQFLRLHGNSDFDLIDRNEQFWTSHIGIALHERSKKKKNRASFVTFETRVAWIDKTSGARSKRGPRKQEETDGRRFDIVFWQSGRRPKGVVEVKISRKLSGVVSDIKKLKAILSRAGTKRDGSLVWAAFVCRIRKPSELSKKSISDLWSKVYKEIEAAFPNPGSLQQIWEPSDSGNVGKAGVFIPISALNCDR